MDESLPGKAWYIAVGMFRKKLIDLLLGNPLSVSQIARAVKESPSQIADDVRHLLRSLKNIEYQATI